MAYTMGLRVEAPVADTGGRHAKDDVWVAADEGGMSGTSAGNRPLLFRTMKVKGSILHPYRSVWTGVISI